MAVVLMVASTLGASLTVLGQPGNSATSSGAGQSSPSSGGSSAPPVVVSAKAVPTLTITPNASYVGSYVNFSASGFAHSSAFKITSTVGPEGFPGVTACSGETTSTGYYNCTYRIPPSGGGMENFTGSDAKGNSKAAEFTVLPHLALVPSSGLVGTPITFVGTGFSTEELTNKKAPRAGVTWTSPEGSAVACPSATTYIDNNANGTPNGTFTCSYSITAAPAGPHAFLGQSVNSTLNATGVFTVRAGLTVAPSHGPVGTPMTFSGTGYAAGVLVNVSWVHSPLICQSTTLSTGSFSCTFAIPPGTAGGQYNFTATDEAKNAASAAFVVTFLKVLPIGAPVNSTVDFTGSGFDPSVPLNLTWNPGTGVSYLCAPVTTTVAGTLSCNFTIPATPGGSYTFNASDGRGDYATTPLTIEPYLVLNPTFGELGSTVNFRGTGFGSGVQVNVTWVPNGSQVVAFSTTSSATGGFSDAFKVGAPKGGSFLFTATDTESHTASATFAASLLSVSPAAGANGTKLTLMASGFQPSTNTSKISINISSSIGVGCKGSTTLQGTYGCNETFGFAPAGTYLFSAAVGSDIAYANFTVVLHLWTNTTTPKVGFPLVFTPTGFPASTLVTVAWKSNGTTVCSGTTTASGAMNCTLGSFPALPAGPYTFTATDASHNTVSTTVTLIPVLLVSPTVAKPGAQVDFSGGGFGSSVLYNVTSTLGTACTGTTNATGTFFCTYLVPHTVAGKYKFTAADALADTASATLKIGAELTASPTTGPVGTLIAFNGAGFTPGKTANLTVNLTKTGAGLLACAVTVSSSGSFSCTYSMAQAPPGTYEFTARDWNYPKKPYGNNATANFTIVPSLTVTPSSGFVGTAVTFLGEGYTANLGISVTWSGGTACSSTTNATGTFSCSSVIHPAPAGADNFTAATSPSVSANATFTIVPELTVSPTQGAVGTTIGLNGTGFAASAVVSVLWTGGAACTVTSSAVGAFTCPSYLIPPTPAGTYELTAYVGGAAVATTNLTVTPALTVTPNAGPVGTTVTFRATGFGAGATVTISSTLGKACSGPAAANGTFLCSYTLPEAAGGSYSFTASDGTHEASASFTLGTSLSVTPALGTVGTLLHFTGTAFAKNASITISWTGGTICSGTTNVTGGYQCSATMPAAALGSHTFTAVAGPSASTSFTVKPALSVSPSSGPDGTSVTFTGTGFPATTSSVTTTVQVSWSGPTECNATTASNGSFSCVLVIPLSTAGGVYVFTATDSDSDTATATFQVITGLLDTPGHGPDLTLVTFTGTNFADYASVDVNSSISTSPACSTTTGGTGEFNCTYTIPSGTPGGTYRFTAEDSTRKTASVLFVVTYLTASPTGVEVGTVVTLSGGGFNAAAGITVSAPWGIACDGSTGAAGTFSCTATIPASATTGEYDFQATDNVNTATAGFGVFTVSAPTASPSSVDANQEVTFSVTASGGTGVTLTYSWNHLPTGCVGSGASFTCTPTGAVTSTAVTVNVSDPDGYTVLSPALPFTVYSDPTQAQPLVSRSTVDVGQTVTFTASVKGGSGGGSYVWSFSATMGCTASTTATLGCTPTGPGSFTVSYNWSDSNSMSATGVTAQSYTVYADPTQAPAVPSQAAADIGQTVAFKASVTYGSGGGTYAWSSTPSLDCTATTGATLSCTPSAAGTTFTVSFNWTDSNGVKATGSTTLTYTVYTDPTITPPTASVATVDVNQSVTFKVTVSGGSGGFTYTWLGLPPGCTGTGASFTCKPTGAVTGASITVKANDSDGYTVTSAPLTFTVYSDPVVLKPSPSAASADVGQTVTFTATASGGSGGLTYAWSAPSALGCSASTTSTLTCKTTGAVTNASVTVKVTDSNQFNVTSPALLFTVCVDPVQSPPVPSQSSADIGQTVTFKASVSGGLGPGTFAWTAAGLNCTATTGPTLSCTPNQAGTTFTVSYAWTDANGMAATGSTSTGFTVYANPTLTTPSPSHASGDIGQTITFSTVSSGGSDGYTFTWTVPQGLGCTVQSAPTITCVPTAKGNYTVTVYATDPNGVKSKTVTSPLFQVFVDPSVTAPVPSRASTDVDEPVSFSTVASGGSGGLVYTWTAVGLLGCTAANSPSIMCTPSHTGTTFTVSVLVTDSNGFASPAQTSANFTVYAAPTLTVPIPSAKSADVGEPITFATSPTGGTGILTFTWTASSGLGCTLQNASQIACVPTAKGNFTVTVSAVDTNKASTGAESLTPYQVYAAPVVTNPVVSHGTTDVGNSITFTTTASGGSGGNVYTWTVVSIAPAPVGGLGCPSKSALSIMCTPTAAGTYTVNVTLTDSNGVTSAPGTRSAYLVYTRPAATLTVTPTSVLQGKSVTFTGAATGGSGGYTYSWGALPGGCTGGKTVLTITCTPSSFGTFVVTFTASDTNNGSGTANVTLTVQQSFLGLPANEGYEIVAGAVVAGIAAVSVVAVVISRRRRTKRQQMQF